MTRATDLTHLGQGLAMGSIAIGVTGLISTKMTLEFALEHVWRDWPHSGKFPHVHAGMERNDAMRLFYDSEGRRASYLGYWERDGKWWRPVMRDSIDLDDAEDLMPKFTDVAWDDWVDLARRFAAEFKDHEIERA